MFCETVYVPIYKIKTLVTQDFIFKEVMTSILCRETGAVSRVKNVMPKLPEKHLIACQ